MASTLPLLTPQQAAQNQSPNIIGASIVLPLLATIALSFRYIARTAHGQKLQADDFFLVPAVVVAWGLSASTIVCQLLGTILPFFIISTNLYVFYIAAANGLGKHSQTILADSPQKFVTALEAYYTTEPQWAASVGLVKISLLLLYSRLFGRLRYIRMSTWILGVFTVAWIITVVFVCIFQCLPVAAAWDPLVSGRCIEKYTFFQIGSTLNTATDFAILILPLPAIVGLSLKNSNKLMVVGIFLLGSLTCIFSLIRTVYVFTHSNDPDLYVINYVVIFSVAEPTLGIVSACLITFRPLLQTGFFQSIRSKLTGSTTARRTNSSGDQHTRLESAPTSLHSYKQADSANDSQRGILVHTRWEQTTSK